MLSLRLPAFLSKKKQAPAPQPEQQKQKDDIVVTRFSSEEGDAVNDDDEDAVDVDEAGALDTSLLVKRLQVLFKDPRYQPPTPPSVALELLALSRRTDVDVDDAVALFARDPMLTARVLRVARSPLYGSANVPTLKDAVVRLGMRRLHHVVLEAALELRVFRSAAYGAWMERVRQHSIAVGHVAAHIAYLGSVDPDQALVAGLVHDVGLAAVIGAVGERVNDFKDVDKDALAAALADVHGDVGLVVAEAWQLSGEVKAVVGHHHDIRRKGDALLAVVVVAEALCAGQGKGVDVDAFDLDPFGHDDLKWAMRCLDVDEHQLQRIERELQPLFDML